MSRDESFYEKLIGTRHHYLVIERLIGFREEKNHKRALYLCRCDCGKEKIAKLPHLQNGNVQSCGCKRKNQYNNRWEGHGEIGLTLWSRYKDGAAKRDIPFSVDIEYAWKLFLSQNRKCALSGVAIMLLPQNRLHTASLDRIDSSKGYIEDNVQWVHKDVNVMKRSLSDAEFIEFCHKVATLHPRPSC